MTYVDPSDYASHEQIGKRLRDSIRQGYEPMHEMRRIVVPFKDDFDELCAVVAHTIRRRLIYRTDNGRLARGLVRYSGQLYDIYVKNMKRQGARKLATLVLRVIFYRRKTENPSGRWVMNIGFEEILIDVEDGDKVVAGKEASDHSHVAKTNAFIAIGTIAAQDMGCRGDQLGRLFEYAAKIGYPANQGLWYYNHNAVFEFVNNMTDTQRSKLPNAVPQLKGAHGVPLMSYPFTGKLLAPRLKRQLDWQIFPFKRYRWLGQSSEAFVQRELYDIYDDVQSASDIVADAFGLSQGTVAPSKYVAHFGKTHLSDLLRGRNTKHQGTESVHHIFEPRCR